MGKSVALCLLRGVLILVLIAFQSGSATEAKGRQRSGASRPGKVSKNQSPEMKFLKRIADATKRNDAKELASMLHPDVIASFGEEKCIAAFQQEKAPDMVIKGRPTRLVCFLPPTCLPANTFSGCSNSLKRQELSQAWQIGPYKLPTDRGQTGPRGTALVPH